MKKKRKWIDYKKYITSVDWLLKKHKLISLFLKRKLPVNCCICNATSHINVHHRHYKNLGKEKMEDLEFLCKDCHKKWHFDAKFKQQIQKLRDEEFLDTIDFLNRSGIFNKQNGK